MQQFSDTYNRSSRNFKNVNLFQANLVATATCVVKAKKASLVATDGKENVVEMVCRADLVLTGPRVSPEQLVLPDVPEHPAAMDAAAQKASPANLVVLASLPLLKTLSAGAVRSEHLGYLAALDRKVRAVNLVCLAIPVGPEA